MKAPRPLSELVRVQHTPNPNQLSTIFMESVPVERLDELTRRKDGDWVWPKYYYENILKKEWR